MIFIDFFEMMIFIEFDIFLNTYIDFYKVCKFMDDLHFYFKRFL